MNKKIFIKDFILNFIAIFLPIFTLQFIIQPMVANKLNNNEIFGLLLTILALLNMTSGIFGNSLNNVFLLNKKLYSNKKPKNINILFLISIIVDFFVIFVFTWFYEQEFNPLSIFICIITGILMSASQYMEAEYRINLNYKKILFSSCFQMLGYIAGFIIFYYLNFWQSILIFPAIFKFLFDIFSTKILTFPYKKDENFKTISFSFLFVFSASLVGSIVSYFDKLIIYPMFGGTDTSIYNTATLAAKTITLAIGPLTSLMLSYLVNIKQIKLKNFNLITIILLISIIPLFIFIYFVSKLILPFLYPQYATEAMFYVPFTASALILTVFISIYNPISLRFNGEKYQLIIKIAHMILYIGLSIGGILLWGLLGFCIAQIITNLIIVIFYYILIFIYTKRSNKEKLLKTFINLKYKANFQLSTSKFIYLNKKNNFK